MNQMHDVSSSEAVASGLAWGEETAQTMTPPSHSEAGFTIGELAKEFGVTLRALRFYENKGLIAPQRQGLARLYSQADRDRLALILRGKKLGFTLGEIREMVAAANGEDEDALRLSRDKCQQQIALLEQQKADIEEGLEELRRIYAALPAVSE
jgi:DNA-binding transcriptional MerR regulator